MESEDNFLTLDVDVCLQVVHLKIKILASFIHHHVVPNLQLGKVH